MNDLMTLHRGLTERKTPEQVLAVLSDLGALDFLDGTGRGRRARELARRAHHSMMSTRFRKHAGLDRAAASAFSWVSQVAQTAGRAVPAEPDGQDVASLRAFVAEATALLGLPAFSNEVRRTATAKTKTVVDTYPAWTDWEGVVHPETQTSYSWRHGSRGRRGDSHGHADPRAAMSADRRRRELPGVSVRAYRHAVRAVNHLEQRLGVFAAERDREAAVAFGKGRLAYTIEVDAFCANTPTAAFVSYYVARLGLRTVFTNGQQDRPMDEIAEALLDAALADPGCRADVIARVLTRQSVLALLTEEQKGELLGVYHAQLTAFSRALAGCFDPKRDRTRMVARPGDDSSTWNQASRAFNQARTGWLNLTRALGMDWVAEAACPGKVPALVAADVAHWHSVSGGSAHVDGQVFARLPLPWEVILGTAECSADLVRQVCAEEGLDADATGWTQAYRQDGLAVAAATPELVHGVTVESPELAAWLRSAGAFSGALTGVSVGVAEPAVAGA